MSLSLLLWIIGILIIYTILYYFCVRRDFTKEEWRRASKKWK